MADEQQTTARERTAAARYAQLETERLPYLERAREAAKYTIPGLFPPMGHTGASKLPQPYQSVGADGLNNLAAKIFMVLFPAGQSCFRLTMDDFVVEALAQKAQANGQSPEDARATFEEALGKVERAITNRMEQVGSRTINFEAIQQLILSGNGLLQVLPDGAEKFYTLDKYVVKRDLEGTVLEIVVKECLARLALPPVVQEFLKTHTSSSPANDAEKNVDLYTWIVRTPRGSWTVQQEVEGSIIPGTTGTYPKDKSAWIPLRWRIITHEDYGRGRVEEYIGDLISCESLSESIVGFAAQAAKIVWMVDENGQTDKKKVARARTGAVISGKASDVTVLQLEKMQDFQVAKSTLDAVTKRIDRAFLNASSVQRDAERVTAEEIRAMIGELEQSLGGVYSLLATEFQKPLVTRVMLQMMKAREIPPLPDKNVAPQIVTGMDGLGRQTDLQRLDAFISGAIQELSPQVVAQWVNVGAYLTRRGAALGLDITGLVKTQDQVDQANQALQQQQLQQKAAPNAVKSIGDHSLQAQAQAAQPQQQAA